MPISWAVVATVFGLTVALLLGVRINHSSRKETDAAIRRNRQMIAEVSTLLGGMRNAVNTQSDYTGDSGNDQRILPDAGGSPVDSSTKG